MRVKSFTLKRPDAENNMEGNIEIAVDNPTDHEVGRIACTWVIVDRDGFPISAENNHREECQLDRGDECTLKETGYCTLPSFVAGDGRDELKVRVNATLYAREFHKLGEIPVPNDDQTTACLTAKIKSELLEGNVPARLIRYLTDDDGGVRIESQITVRSKSDLTLPDTTLATLLVDRDGHEMVQHQRGNVDMVTLREKAMTSPSTFHYCEDKRKLKGAKLRLELKVFRPVAMLECEGIVKPAKKK